MEATVRLPSLCVLIRRINPAQRGRGPPSGSTAPLGTGPKGLALVDRRSMADQAKFPDANQHAIRIWRIRTDVRLTYSQSRLVQVTNKQDTARFARVSTQQTQYTRENLSRREREALAARVKRHRNLKSTYRELAELTE